MMGSSFSKQAAAVFVVTALGVAWACTGPDMPPILGDNDAGNNRDGASKDAAGDANGCEAIDGGCNTLSNCGSQVSVVWVASYAPSPEGGIIADGTYVLDSYKVFTGDAGGSGPQPAWYRQTMAMTTIDAGASDGGDAGGEPSQQMQWLEVSQTNASPTTTVNGTLLVIGPTSLVIDYSCPSDSGVPFGSTFSATTTSVTLFVGDTSGTGQLTYVKQ